MPTNAPPGGPAVAGVLPGDPPDPAQPYPDQPVGIRESAPDPGPVRSGPLPARFDPGDGEPKKPPIAEPAVARPAGPPKLDDLIRAEEARLAVAPADPGAKRSLGVLYALAGRWTESYKMLEGEDLGRDTLLRLVFACAGDKVNEHGRAMDALERVRAEWRTVHPLRITHAAFCSSARAFQDYVSYAKDEFEPGQLVGVYFELDDFALRPGRGGEWEVSIHADVEVVAPGPQVIRLPDGEKYTQDLERSTPRPVDDLCLGLRLRLPRNLIPGAYQLRLTVEDRLAQKKAERMLDFRIR